MPHIPKNFGGGSKGKRFIFRRMFPGGDVVVGLTVFVCGGFEELELLDGDYELTL